MCFSALVAVGDEGQLDDGRRVRLAAHDELHRRAGLGVARLDVAHRDRPAGGRAEAAARDLADSRAVPVPDLAVLARRRAALRPDADELAGRPLGELPA